MKLNKRINARLSGHIKNAPHLLQIRQIIPPLIRLNPRPHDPQPNGIKPIIPKPPYILPAKGPLGIIVPSRGQVRRDLHHNVRPMQG